MQCSTSSANAAAPREVAPFLKSLRRMLQDESEAVLRWTPDGRAFEIHDMHEMMGRVLPKYFKHCKYTSFQRQLNYFSFRKWTKSKAVVCTFSNDFFLRDQPELAWRITRKKSLSPHAQPKYRATVGSRANSSAHVPYWKKEPVLQATSPPHLVVFDNMLLPSGYRLPFPCAADADLMLKQHDVRHSQQSHPDSRRYYGFNVATPVPDAYGLAVGNDLQQHTEPLDWIDCLLPPTDDAYPCMYPPAAGVAPYSMTNPMSSRKCFPEFVPSSI